MNYPWSKTVLPIAVLFSCRMFGLFLLIPVLSVYGQELKNATPALIGLALGGYGLTQAILQMPFGLMSDKWGRKPIITLGLILFISGSLLGAQTHSIYGMIGARILQGAGAIGSVLIALMADFTPIEVRTKAMAIIGMTIGISFGISMVVSPALTAQYGLAGIFYFTALLGSIGLVLLHFVIPTPTHELFHEQSEVVPSRLKSVLQDIQLRRLNLGIFCQHFILTATFFALPLLIHQAMKDFY
jgi:MFS family permease